ncbi:hypothetical protein NAC44_06025 [Allorhizobium sp. BGMRC 0089]|uniref:hypothetical protein n=1 Tax=Allorhizobium sonneratiae TaxID=2934936 RepID=UPI0020340AA1|nr:hypothetical protein [Allorhizobium sonneratiae]MCM2291884.1 hypothetical protein [Allorhizobium sonneratiae]
MAKQNLKQHVALKSTSSFTIRRNLLVQAEVCQQRMRETAACKQDMDRAAFHQAGLAGGENGFSLEPHGKPDYFSSQMSA